MTLRRYGIVPAAVLLSGIVAVLITTSARWGPDWPAQEFRAWIAVHDGLSTWTARWYGGAPLPGYSVLYPPLAAVGGAAGVGIASVLAATWASTRLAPPAGIRRVVFITGSVVILLETLVIGQIPFLLGIGFGVSACAFLLERRSWLLVACFAALCSLASPLAGALLLLVGPACAVVVGVRAAAALSPALVGPLVSAVVGGASGPFPIPWQTFASIVAFCLLVLLLAPRDQPALRVFALCYLLADVVVFVVPNPVGGNLSRLGKLIALPLACHFLVRKPFRRHVGAFAASVLALLWPTAPFVGSISNGADDPSQAASFYAAPVAYLQSHLDPGARVEIPFTREHWETYYVARRVPIARGWERQTDYQYNDLLYQPLTPIRYRQWLAANSVEYVALPDVPIDVGGEAERRILQSGPSFLTKVWRDADWTIWRVRDATSLVTGPAVLRDLDPASITVAFSKPGRALVRVRYSALWQAAGGGACVAPSPGGWLLVSARRPGPVDLVTDLNGVLATQSGCSSS